MQFLVFCLDRKSRLCKSKIKMTLTTLVYLLIFGTFQFTKLNKFLIYTLSPQALFLIYAVLLLESEVIVLKKKMSAGKCVNIMQKYQRKNCLQADLICFFALAGMHKRVYVRLLNGDW